MNSFDTAVTQSGPVPREGEPLPPVWALALALLGLSLVTAAALAPPTEAAFRSQPEALAATLRTGLWITAAAAPLVALGKGAVLGAIAWAVLVLGGKTPRYRSALAIVVTGELILAAQALWIALLIRVRGLAAISSPEDLRIPTGLDLLFPDPTTPLGALAGSVTPFHAAWVLFLAWRFGRAVGAPVWGVVAALACWMPGALVDILRTLLA